MPHLPVLCNRSLCLLPGAGKAPFPSHALLCCCPSPGSTSISSAPLPKATGNLPTPLFWHLSRVSSVSMVSEASSFLIRHWPYHTDYMFPSKAHLTFTEAEQTPADEAISEFSKSQSTQVASVIIIQDVWSGPGHPCQVSMETNSSFLTRAWRLWKATLRSCCYGSECGSPLQSSYMKP